MRKQPETDKQSQPIACLFQAAFFSFQKIAACGVFAHWAKSQNTVFCRR
jgi:hypothetical protein